jgi:hypothetical protein
MEEETNTKPTETVKLSVLEETKAAIAELKKEREEISKVKDELQQFRSEQLLSGTAGQHIETPKLSEEEQKKQKALEFWKGSGVEDAIKKHG